MDPLPHQVVASLTPIVGNTFARALELERNLWFRSVKVDQGIYTAFMAHGNRLVTVKFRIREPSIKDYQGTSRIIGACNCGEETCLHGEAALIHYFRDHRPGVNESADEEEQLSLSARDMLRTLKRAQSTQAALTPREAGEHERLLLYILEDHDGLVDLASAKRLKNGAISISIRRERDWHSAIAKEANTSRTRGIPFSEEDRQLARRLFVAGALPDEGGTLRLAGVDPSEVLAPLSATGRLISISRGTSHPVLIGQAKSMSVMWRQGEFASGFRLAIEIDHSADIRLLPTSPPWYFDPNTLLMGPVSNVLSDVVLEVAKQGCQLQTSDLPQFHKLLKQLGSIPDLPPLPEVKTVNLGVFRPLRILRLDQTTDTRHWGTTRQVTGTVLFDYQGRRIQPSHPSAEIVFLMGTNQTRIDRDLAYERQSVQSFNSASKSVLSEDGVLAISSLDEDGDDYMGRALAFQTDVLPALLKDGWRLEYSPTFDIKIVSTRNWDLSVDEDEPGWYQLRLGTTVDGREIDLIAVLRSLLANPAFERDISADDKEKSWWHRLETGEYIEIDIRRVRRLARLLLEVGNGSRDQGKPLKISRFDVGVLEGLQGDSRIIVHGADHLLQLAEALARPPAPLPKAATHELARPLRPYQTEGVAWMQSRLAAGVGLVLADEMAAGKTLETLVHVWCEAQRSQALPSLIVLPKTLVSKWKSEAATFLPTMKMTAFYGQDRTLALAREAQVVLTTYKTLVLDAKEFLDVKWNIVACDEGHILRNPDTEMARAMRALTARQKIIVSGTVIQNHQDDLWSAMNIVAPGLLRDRRWFRQRFGPEVMENPLLATQRKKLLGLMTAPYCLKRSNEEIGNQLPPCNHVKLYIDLGEAQRDVYETVRATLDSKVRSLIAEKGLARNHITVLAAITKLRQICCHPELVKSGEVPPNTPSAKLEQLVVMVEELHAEGKLVVITSQWVEVLKIIATRLDQADLSYRMLFGGQTTSKRDEAIATFRSGRVKFLLMTLAIGGEGLDLPEGDVIVIFDPWWNAKRMEQAVARLRRDGRKKQITAIHMIAKGTLEEGVVAIGERKNEMIEEIYSGANGKLGAAHIADISMLFSAQALES